jgi:hypothetical protein
VVLAVAAVRLYPSPSQAARLAPGGPPVSSGPGEEIPALKSPHLPYVAAPHAPYNSVPPTSGPHVHQTVTTGLYRHDIPEELQVHALEHGHVLVQYAPGTSAEEVRLLETIVRFHLRDVVLAPYAKLDKGVALTAWGRLARLDHPDRRTIEFFVETFAGRYNHGWQHRGKVRTP